MTLTEYLDGVHSEDLAQLKTGFPAELVLPDNLTKKLAEIYRDGESNGAEFGYTAFFRDGRGIDIEHRVQGGATNCQTIHTEDPDAFGDMHSHPSASIGHANGFSANSLEDYMIFKRLAQKALFIRFVASGPYIYAVIHRKGLTRFVESDVRDLLYAHDEAKNDFFTEGNPFGEDWKTEIANITMNGSVEPGLQRKIGLKAPLTPQQLDARRKRQADRQLVEWKIATPNLGEWLMQRSIEYNRKMAYASNYGFYCARRSNTMKLEAGPKFI